MKKWLISLSVIFGVGFITSVILAGKVYYSDLQTYEDYDKQIINVQNLENLYIDSDVPVEVQVTDGEPYAEFTQTFTDLVGMAPKYQLEVEEKGNSTHILLTQIEDVLLGLGIRESKAKLIVYLPEGTLERLDIESQNSALLNSRNQMINLEGIDIGELNINTEKAAINLKGNYKKVNILAMNNSSLNMISGSPVKLYTEFLSKQHIEGVFEKIDIKESYGIVNINSLQPCKVKLENNNGTIQLEGQYEKIDLEGRHMEVELESQTQCKLNTQGYDNMVYASGAFKTMNLEETESEVEIQTTVIPDSIRMLEEANRSSLSLTLPSNIPGITLKYMNPDGGAYDYSNQEDNSQWTFTDHQFKLESEFLPINKSIENGHFVYKYGKGEIPILINQNSDIVLELIDGGYTSVSQNK